MAEAASQVIVAADSSKIGVIGLTGIVQFSMIATLVTDADAPSDFVNSLRESGTEVILV